MKARPFRGFTLVELLVVITVIGTLMGMLLPAVNYFMETARRNTCNGNQHNLALALISFAEADRGRFPGYVNCVGPSTSPIEASWVAMILPQLERSDLWEVWRQGGEYDPNTAAASSSNNSSSDNQSSDSQTESRNPRKAYLKILVCPSSPPDNTGPNDAPLRYVVNSGYLGGISALPQNAVYQAYGVCFWNGIQQGVSTNKYRVTSDYISLNDGTSNTLLLAENVNAGDWALDTTIWEGKYTGQTELGFVWHSSEDNLVNHVNRDYRNTDDRYREDPHARPSSRHSGGAVVSFCDGHQHFLREDTAPRVYWHLMTPNGKGIKMEGVRQQLMTPLSDSEY